MKRCITIVIIAALRLHAQVPTIPNSDFPTFRANLNTSLGNAASISGAYSNPSFITSLAFPKLSGVPPFARTDQGNTWTVGAQDFSGAGSLRAPNIANCTPVLDGQFCYDSVLHIYRGFGNGAAHNFAFTDSNVTGNTTGNAATATALAATPALCSAGNYPLGVDTHGNAVSCTAAGGGGGGGIVDPGSNGFLDRTLLNTTVARTLTGTANLIVITNGGGGGDPVFTVGSSVARLDISSAYGAGVSVNMSPAAHLRLPNAASYTPTALGHIGYDTSTNTYRGFNGGVKTFAFLDSNITGNAATATALAANGTNCSAGSYPLGVDAGGNAEGCTVASGSGTVTVLSSGSMASTAIATGGGGTTVQTPSSTATLDTSGNISTAGGISTGVGTGVSGHLGWGSGTATAAPTGFVGWQAPATVTTPFYMNLPDSPATGFLLNTGTADPSVISFVASTGSGNVVRATSPTITSANLGTPSVINISNATGLTSAQLPNPASGAGGKVRSIDCTGTGHILSINTDSTVTCSADATTGGATTNQNIRTIGFEFGGSSDSTHCVLVPFGGTIQRAVTGAESSGNATVAIATVPMASWTGSGSATTDVINAGTHPSLSASPYVSVTTLTSWTTAVTADTWYCATLSSVTAGYPIHLALKVAAN